jgi:hypothetical protein
MALLDCSGVLVHHRMYQRWRIVLRLCQQAQREARIGNRIRRYCGPCSSMRNEAKESEHQHAGICLGDQYSGVSPHKMARRGPTVGLQASGDYVLAGCGQRPNYSGKKLQFNADLRWRQNIHRYGCHRRRVGALYYSPDRQSMFCRFSYDSGINLYEQIVTFRHEGRRAAPAKLPTSPQAMQCSQCLPVSLI